MNVCSDILFIYVIESFSKLCPCRSTENSHVKTNLVHDLHQVRKFGLMPVEQMKGIISPSDFERVKTYVRQSWFSLPADIFTTLIFRVSPFQLLACCHFSYIQLQYLIVFSYFCLQQDIAMAGDEEVKKYCENTPEEDITSDGIKQAFLKGMKDKTTR